MSEFRTVAVRFTDGDTRAQARTSRGYPAYMRTPEFLTGDERPMRIYLNSAPREDREPVPVAPSGRGLLMIDYISRQIIATGGVENGLTATFGSESFLRDVALITDELLDEDGTILDRLIAGRFLHLRRRAHADSLQARMREPWIVGETITTPAERWDAEVYGPIALTGKKETHQVEIGLDASRYWTTVKTLPIVTTGDIAATKARIAETGYRFTAEDDAAWADYAEKRGRSRADA